MTSDRPSGDAPAPDDEDWWQGDVDTARPPSDPSPTAGGDTAVRAAPSRPRWLIGAAAAVAVAAIAVAVLATRGGGSSDDPDAADAATGGNGAGPGGGAGGAGPGGFGSGTAGTVTEVDAASSTLVVETAEGDTVEVTATGDTTISETVDGAADDLTVGDSVLVVGATSGGGEDGGPITAQQVVASSDSDLLGGGPLGGGGFPGGGDGERPEPPEGGFPGGAPPGDGERPEGFDPPEGVDPSQGGGPGGGPGGFTTGTIASIDDGSLSVRTADDETVTVTLSSETSVLLSRELSFDDLATGDEITVTGEEDGGTVEAVVIRRGEDGLGFGGGRPPGGADVGDDADADDDGSV
jgi:hypothetical protein